jgi:hypothetical protein
LNRSYNIQVISRRLASRVNWLRKIFRKGKKMFFQWEYTAAYFNELLTRNGWAVCHRQYIWLELGLQDDFRGLYPIVKRPVFYLSNSKSRRKLIGRMFAAFMLFVCEKNNPRSRPEIG